MPFIRHCTLCPRRCGADRTQHAGPCGGAGQVKLARAALHQWEEPCISGKNGAGSVFFSGCSLGCVYCQNASISWENFGKEISVERLAEIFLELQEQGAHNLDLVTPTHYRPWILEALALIQKERRIPVVWNTSGYETLAGLKELEGYVDVYLPDYKYADPARAARYRRAADYPGVALAAVQEMFRQTGPAVFSSEGLMKKGVLIRHLVLPKGRFDSIAAMDLLSQALPPKQVRISLMSQYVPMGQAVDFPEINRRVSTFEYQKVVEHALELGFEGYTQSRSAAQTVYTPHFGLEGV